MSFLLVTDRRGQEHRIEGQDGRSVMQIIRDSGVEHIQAICGGCCSCGTCHVYVDPRFSNGLPAMADDERDLLDFSEFQTETSRLSCQIRFGPELNGLTVTVAPEG